MRFLERKATFLLAFLGVSFLHSAGACVADGDQPQAQKYPVILKGSDDPSFEKAIDFLGGEAPLNLPGVSYPGESSLKDRILDGFEAAPSSRKLDDGTTIFWGFKHEEAIYKSVAITDSKGHLCMVGAVTNVIPLLRADSTQPIATNNEGYQAKVKEYGLGSASIVLVVRSSGDLNFYLPLIRRWNQALLLSFIADCDVEKYKFACEISQKLEIPISAYQAVFTNKNDLKSAKLKEVPVPPLPADKISIKTFN